MVRALAILVGGLVACTSSPDACPCGKIVSAKVEVVGGSSFMVAIDATLTADFADGSPVWTSQTTNTLHDTSNFDTLALSAAGQLWHDGAVIHFVDMRTTAPAAVVARCGATVGLTLVVGVGDGSGGAIGSTQATSDVMIDCR